MSQFAIQVALIVILGTAICALLYPAPFVFGLARIVSRLHATYRRYLVRKYGSQTAHEYHQFVRKQMLAEGFTEEEITASFHKHHKRLTQRFGKRIVHREFGEPSRLDRLMGVAE